MTAIVLGTRGSTLALAQANLVADLLRARGHDARISILSTRGDREQERPVPELGGKGLFTAELEEALLEGSVDAAVHSLKDLPTEAPAGLVLAAVPRREDPRDALVSKEGRRLADLPKGARVGTASLRRKALLLHARPDLEIHPLRGNVDTRIRKVKEGDLQAAVLAAAGLKRIGRADAIAELLDFLPAPAQGAIGIQARADREPVLAALRSLEDRATAACAAAERELLRILEGGCSVPVGALAEPKGASLRLRALVAAPDGSRVLSAEGEGADPLALGAAVARRLLDLGAGGLLRG